MFTNHTPQKRGLAVTLALLLCAGLSPGWELAGAADAVGWDLTYPAGFSAQPSVSLYDAAGSCIADSTAWEALASDGTSANVLTTKSPADALFAADTSYYAVVTAQTAENTYVTLVEALGTGVPAPLQLLEEDFAAGGRVDCQITSMPDATEMQAKLMELYAAGATQEEIEAYMASFYSGMIETTGTVGLACRIGDGIYLPAPYTRDAENYYAAGDYVLSYASGMLVNMSAAEEDTSDTEVTELWQVQEPVTVTAGSETVFDFRNLQTDYAEKTGTLRLKCDGNAMSLQVRLPIGNLLGEAAVFGQQTPAPAEYILHTTPFSGQPRLLSLMALDTASGLTADPACLLLAPECTLAAGGTATLTVPALAPDWESTLVLTDCLTGLPVTECEAGTLLLPTHQIARDGYVLLAAAQGNEKEKLDVQMTTAFVPEAYTAADASVTGKPFAATESGEISATSTLPLYFIEGAVANPADTFVYEASTTLTVRSGAPTAPTALQLLADWEANVLRVQAVGGSGAYRLYRCEADGTAPVEAATAATADFSVSELSKLCSGDGPWYFTATCYDPATGAESAQSAVATIYSRSMSGQLAYAFTDATVVDDTLRLAADAAATLQLTYTEAFAAEQIYLQLYYTDLDGKTQVLTEAREAPGSAPVTAEFALPADCAVLDALEVQSVLDGDTVTSTEPLALAVWVTVPFALPDLPSAELVTDPTLQNGADSYALTKETFVLPRAAYNGLTLHYGLVDSDDAYTCVPDRSGDKIGFPAETLAGITRITPTVDATALRRLHATLQLRLFDADGKYLGSRRVQEVQDTTFYYLIAPAGTAVCSYTLVCDDLDVAFTPAAGDLTLGGTQPLAVTAKIASLTEFTYLDVTYDGVEMTDNLEIRLTGSAGETYRTKWYCNSGQLATDGVPAGDYLATAFLDDFCGDEIALAVPEKSPTERPAAVPVLALTRARLLNLQLTMLLDGQLQHLSADAFALCGYNVAGEEIDLTAACRTDGLLAGLSLARSPLGQTLDLSRGLTLTLNGTCYAAGAGADASYRYFAPQTLTLGAAELQLSASGVNNGSYPGAEVLTANGTVQLTELPALAVWVENPTDEEALHLLFQNTATGDLYPFQRTCAAMGKTVLTLGGLPDGDYNVLFYTGAPDPARESSFCTGILRGAAANGGDLRFVKDGVTPLELELSGDAATVFADSRLALNRATAVAGDGLTAAFRLSLTAPAGGLAATEVTLAPVGGWQSPLQAGAGTARLFRNGAPLLLQPTVNEAGLTLTLPALAAGETITGTVYLTAAVAPTAGAELRFAASVGDFALAESAWLAQFTHNLPTDTTNAAPTLSGRAVPPAAGEAAFINVYADGQHRTGRYAISRYGYWGTGAAGDVGFAFADAQSGTVHVTFCREENGKETVLETCALRYTVPERHVAPTAVSWTFAHNSVSPATEQTFVYSTFSEMTGQFLSIGAPTAADYFRFQVRFAEADAALVDNVIITAIRARSATSYPLISLGGGLFEGRLPAESAESYRLGYDVAPLLTSPRAETAVSAERACVAYAAEQGISAGELCEMLRTELLALQSAPQTSEIAEESAYTYTDEAGVTSTGACSLRSTVTVLAGSNAPSLSGAEEAAAYWCHYDKTAGALLPYGYIAAPVISVDYDPATDLSTISLRQRTVHILSLDELLAEAPAAALPGAAADDGSGGLTLNDVTNELTVFSDTVLEATKVKGWYDTAEGVVDGLKEGLEVTGEVAAAAQTAGKTTDAATTAAAAAASAVTPLEKGAGAAYGALGKIVGAADIYQGLTQEQFKDEMNLVTSEDHHLSTMHTFALHTCLAAKDEIGIATLNSLYNEGIRETNSAVGAVMIQEGVNDAANAIKHFLPDGTVAMLVGFGVDLVQDSTNDIVNSNRWQNHNARLLEYQARMNAVADNCRANIRQGEPVAHSVVPAEAIPAENPKPTPPATPAEPPVPARAEEANAAPVIASDPSGIVYAGMKSNPLPGVTCVIEQLVDGAWVEWDATQAMQKNPLLTDETGYYGWDVPAGTWRVKYQLAGYNGGEAVYSDAMDVPPIWLDVDCALFADEATPAVTSVTYADGGLRVKFNVPVRTDLLTGCRFAVAGAAVVQALDGEIGAARNADGTQLDAPLAMEVLFVHAKAVILRQLTTLKLTLSGVTGYTGDVLADTEVSAALPQLLVGDVDGDEQTDAMDAVLVLQAYCRTLLGEPSGLTAQQTAVADLNTDGIVNMVDASLILQVYSAAILGSTVSVPELLAKLR